MIIYARAHKIEPGAQIGCQITDYELNWFYSTKEKAREYNDEQFPFPYLLEMEYEDEMITTMVSCFRTGGLHTGAIESGKILSVEFVG